MYLLAFFVEMAGAIDLVLAIIFLALGLGYVIATLSLPLPGRLLDDVATGPRRLVLLGLVVAIVCSGFYWAESDSTPVKDAVADARDTVGLTPYESVPENPPGVPSMERIYWEQLKPDTCHYRLDDKQKMFISRVDGTLEEPTCGKWPFADPPAPWLLEKITPL